MESQKSPLPPKNPLKQVLEKAFHKMQKHVGLASTKNQPNKMGLTRQYVLRLPSLHRSFQPHTPQSPLPTYHPYSITHTTQHTVATTHSPSQLHLLYTQNSLNTPQLSYWSTSTIIPDSASSINATAWSHSTPQTLTFSTSKQILHYSKHLYHSCWYLKGTVYKAVASCENCEKISGDYKSAMAHSPALWSRGFVPSEDILLPSGTNPRNPWYNYNFTLYSLQCTPQPTIPTNKSYYSQQQVHTTIP